MPKYRITAPDGQTFEVNAPDGATEQDATAYVQKNLYKPRAAAPASAAPDPSEGGLPFRPFGVDTGLTLPQGPARLLAGAGKAFADTGRAAGQYLGLVDRRDVDESKMRDAPLMDTGAGMTGNVLGQIAQYVPLGAGGLAAQIGGGALQGALTPTGTSDSTLGQIAAGGALGAAGPLLLRGGSALLQGGKSLLEPFSQGGREKIAGRVLERFATDLGGVRASTGVMGPTRTGALPTLAEQSGDAGIARLQDALRAVDPQIGNAIEQRLAGNNAARVDRLRELAGIDGGRDAAMAARASAAGPLYERALAQQIDPALTSSGETLMRAPAIRSAAGQARTNALNAGETLTADGSVGGLHATKLALDDAIAKAEQGSSAAEVNRAAALRAARERLLGFIETASPEYRDARMAYAQASRPVNQADVGQHLLGATANTSDLPLIAGDTGAPRLLPDKFLGMLRNGDRTVSQATGRSLGGLDSVMDPWQMNLLRKLGDEVDRSAAVGRAGNGAGSGTAQRLASQNVLQQVIGPTGLPKNWAESVLLTNAARPLQFAMGTAEPAIQQTLARGLLDPGYANKLLDLVGKKDKPKLLGLLDNGLLRAFAAPVAPAAGLLADR